MQLGKVVVLKTAATDRVANLKLVDLSTVTVPAPELVAKLKFVDRSIYCNCFNRSFYLQASMYDVCHSLT